MKFAVWAEPHVNGFASSLAGMPETDPDVVAARNMYPGAEYCNINSPHSLWHQQTGIGFFDFVMLGDFILGLIKDTGITFIEA